MGIRVVIIDPYAQTVENKIIEDSLDAYYEAIGEGCSLVEAIYPQALGGECMYVDEEGLFQQKAGFYLRGWGPNTPLMGRAIILGTDDMGSSVSTTWDADEVLANVTGWAVMVTEES